MTERELDFDDHELPFGVSSRRLDPHRDARGSVHELFRSAWFKGPLPVQWAALESRANVMRGVHVHPLHDDFVVPLSGRTWLGLADLRDDSPTHRRAACVELSASAPAIWTIPHGVAHGLFSPEPGLLLLGTSRAFDPLDEVRCRFDDPALGIPWPAFVRSTLVLSECDRDAQPFAAMLAVYRERSRS